MSPTITVQPSQIIERLLTLEIVRVTERAAVSSARLRGRGASCWPISSCISSRGRCWKHETCPSAW